MTGEERDRRGAEDRIDVEPEALDGHTLEELSAYLDAGRRPRDPSIEGSPGCRMVLEAMERLQGVTARLIEAEVAAEPVPDEGWVNRVLSGLVHEVRSGRRIPIEGAGDDLAITEGALRSLMRSAEEDVPGVVIGRCRVEGEVETPGAPLRLGLDVSVLFGEPLEDTARRVRTAVLARVAAHTALTVTSVDIRVRDVHLMQEEAGAQSGGEGLR